MNNQFWINTKNYPQIAPQKTQLKQLSGREVKQWAWEFLRRNPKYHRDYFKNKEKILEMERIRASGGVVRIPKFIRILQENYGLSGDSFLIDPARDDINQLSFMALSSPSVQTAVPGVPIETHSEWRLKSKTDAFIKIDLSLPLEAQFERVKWFLRGTKKYLEDAGEIESFEKRFHVKLFPHYLQVLDAVSMNIAIEEIAAALLPDCPNCYDNGFLGNQRIRGSFETAKRIRDFDYRYLFVYSPTKR